MNAFKAFNVLLLLVAAPAAAQADGYKLSLQGNKIIARNTEAFRPDGVFGHAFDFVNNIDGTFETSHGSVDANDPGSGFNFGGGQNDSFTYNIKSLWTLDGGGATPATPGMALEILNFSNGDFRANIDGQIATPANFAVAANNTHELIWSIPQSTTTPVWGLAYTISGTSVISGLPYEESDPIVAVQWTPDFQGDTAEVMQVIYAAATGGDFDTDLDVDGQDFLIWQRTLGSAVQLAADASGNQIVDSPDLFSWEINFGRILPAPAMTSVPEPPTSGLILACIASAVTTLRGELKRDRGYSRKDSRSATVEPAATLAASVPWTARAFSRVIVARLAARLM